MISQSENLQSSSSGRFLQSVQPLRDLESNWTVDLAKNLEEYLLKICSGEIAGDDEDALISVNFAEAALLLQGSVQVYSRKVEYLYSLVLHALEFISQKSGEDQAAKSSGPKEASGVHNAKDEDDHFWDLDNIPVETKTSLVTTCKNSPPSFFVRPPANLVVLEGECLDASGEAGELESYLLATNDLYRNFILLDSCDAVAVDGFLDCKAGQRPGNVYRGSSMTSKGHKSFLSPSRHSGGTGHKLSGGKNFANLPKSPTANLFESKDCNLESSPPAFGCSANDTGFGAGDGYSDRDFDDSDNDDDDDPWKPLNPHEQGSLKVKPYRGVKANKRAGVGTRKHLSVSAEFPLAKLSGPISRELTEIWEANFGASGRHSGSQPRPLYEKLRQSLIDGEKNTDNAFYNHDDDNEDNEYDNGDLDTEPPEFHKPDNTFSNEDVPPNQEKHDDDNHTFEGSDSHANLEDLCRSHLDALLSTLSETDKQNELASRVSTWKQRIEQNLEEQDSRPPFDIHKYGERVLDKLSVEGDTKKVLPFGDVVRGQEKHDVARTFSAMLQLVNNGDIDLVRSSTSTCHSDVNPFHIRLLKNERRKGVTLQSSKKRVKSPLVKGCANAKTSNKDKENCPIVNSSPSEYSSGFKLPVNTGKARCTPEGKKRRKSRLVAPLNMHFAG